MAEVSVAYEKVCQAGFYAAGLQPWERAQSVFRLTCALITVSIVSAWFSRRGVGRLMLLFLHWLGGLVHLLSGIAMTQMVLNCWISAELVPFIKALKFLELAGSNLVAVTNLAICAKLALIVHSHRTMTRTRNVSSFRMVCFFVLISVAGAALAVPYFEIAIMSGTTFVFAATTVPRNNWVSVSYFLLESIAGFVMAIIVALLLLLRRSELKQVWKLHRRIKFHVALTVIALMVNIVITVASILLIVNDGPFRLLVVSWTLRYIHIALDTLVLYSALETPMFDLGNNFEDSSRPSGSYSQNAVRY